MIYVAGMILFTSLKRGKRNRNAKESCEPHLITIFLKSRKVLSAPDTPALGVALDETYRGTRQYCRPPTSALRRVVALSYADK